MKTIKIKKGHYVSPFGETLRVKKIFKNGQCLIERISDEAVFEIRVETSKLWGMVSNWTYHNENYGMEEDHANS